MLHRLLFTGLLFWWTVLTLGAASPEKGSPAGFITCRGGHFYDTSTADAGTPYYFVGANMWYAPYLGIKGKVGDRARLKRELDRLSSLGITNLRILVGAEAGSDSVTSVRPYLQPSLGVLNDTVLDGLDYLLHEMERRGMKSVIYLCNSWDWSGGYGFYLKQTGHGDSPYARGKGYSRYTHYAAAFATDTIAQQYYYDFLRRLLTHTNRYTRRPYSTSSAIMAWQICNEPRPFDAQAKRGFLTWITRSARLIKSLDPNHLVSVGSEGYYGCEGDISLYEQIHRLPEIDYLTIHLWPLNWGWCTRGALYTALPHVYLKAAEYIDAHLRLAERLGKPLVIEEFGYPRERNHYAAGTSTLSRDAFYNYLFDRFRQSRQHEGLLAGINFWGWGGEARPLADQWAPGMPYLTDPPHEPQGWYSVYDSDTTTIHLIEKYIHGDASTDVPSEF